MGSAILLNCCLGIMKVFVDVVVREGDGDVKDMDIRR